MDWEAYDGSIGKIPQSSHLNLLTVRAVLPQVNRNKFVIVTEKRCEYFNPPEYDAVQIRSWVPIYQSAMHHVPE